MNPLTLTLSFLLLFGILTMGHVKRFTEHSFQHILYRKHVENREKLEKEYMQAKLHDLRRQYCFSDEATKVSQKKPKKESTGPKKVARRSIPLDYDLTRPPNNSRLNFFPLIHFEKMEKRYEQAACLLRNLYQPFSFFNVMPELEYRLLKALMAQKEHTEAFIFADELATLQFEDNDLQNAFYTMLKGGWDEESQTEIPSLLDYICFDKGPNNKNSPKLKINLLFASPAVLKSILQDEALVQSLVEARQKLWQTILYQKEQAKYLQEEDILSRKQIADEMQSTFTYFIERKGLNVEEFEPYFDFTLGKPGNILFIRNPKTGMNVRQKIELPP